MTIISIFKEINAKHLSGAGMQEEITRCVQLEDLITMEFQANDENFRRIRLVLYYGGTTNDLDTRQHN